MQRLLTCLLLGSAARATEVVLDRETRLVMLDRWQLQWPTEPAARRFGAQGHATLGAIARIRDAAQHLG